VKFPATIRVPSLGGIELVVEVELPDDLLARPQAPATLTDAELRARWRCSARTLARLRTERRLPFATPTPRRVVYALADVEAYEREHRTEVGVLRPRRIRGSR